MKQYDAIVIGAGQAGVPLAKKLALAGKRTALIEKRYIGGTCVNDGCMPTKTMVASAKMAYLAGVSAPLGVKIKKFTVDMPTVKKRKDDVVNMFRNGSQRGLEKTKGLDILFGNATFTGDKTLSVKMNDGGTRELKADLVFINTGAKTTVPDIDGLADIGYLTSTTILDLDEVPEHLLVIGGNYIGLEFGQMFRRFGSKVTVVERSNRIVSHEDEDVSAEMTKHLEAEKIKILTNAGATAFKQKKKGGRISATIYVNDETQKIKCSHVLVAVGRTPQTGTLGLSIAGVKTDEHGHIITNTKLETNIPGIYALGDVKGGPAFTHIAYNDYTIVNRKNLYLIVLH